MLDHTSLTLLAAILTILPLLSTRLAWNELSVALTILSVGVLIGWIESRKLNKEFLLLFLVSVLLLNAQLGVAQFIFQQDLGLHVIGESRLSPDLEGWAKFNFAGRKLIRGYGFFEHANIFGGLMVLGVAMMIGCWHSFKSSGGVIFFIVVSFFLTLGVAVSFSRSAYLAFLLFAVVWLWSRCTVVRLRYLPPFIVLFIVILPMIIFRTNDFEDKGIAERVSGATWALAIAKDNSVWSGEDLNYESSLRDYLEVNHIGHEAWQIDYVHSIPLLLIAVMGIIPAALLTIILLVYLRYLYRESWVWLVPILPMILFDHYFITEISAFIIIILFVLLMPRFTLRCYN